MKSESVIFARLLAEAEHESRNLWQTERILQLPSVRKLIALPAQDQVLIVILTLEKLANRIKSTDCYREGAFLNLHSEDGSPMAGIHIVKRLLRRNLPFTNDQIHHALECLSAIDILSTFALPFLVNFVSLLEARSEKEPLPRAFNDPLKKIAKALSIMANASERKLLSRVQALMRLRARNPKAAGTKQEILILLQPGEAWSDAAISAISSLKPEALSAWAGLIGHCFEATAAAPSAKWGKLAREKLKAVGSKQFAAKVLEWFPLVNQPRTQPLTADYPEYQPDPNQLIIEPHMNILRGLAWCCSFREDADLARALSNLARSAYRKIPLLGPRATRVGNACVTALGLMPGMEGVYQLAFLKVKVKFGTAQKTIEKAFDNAAVRAGLARDEIEEMAVPSYGLSAVGFAEEKIGPATARLTIAGTHSAEITWVKEDGKEQRGVPAIVKAKHAADLKELQATAKDIQKMLPAQRERMDGLFLQQRVWPVAVWRERYLDHPLTGVLARRLLWQFSMDGETRTGIWFGDRLVDFDLREIKLPESATVQLWHPIGKDVGEIAGWRGWFDSQQIQQPFKQAHREIYLLTDAELRTGTYSNRYAAHLLKQHQFNALCALRGWKNKLRLLVDAEYPPASISLRKWGLRAEFWIEGVGDDYGNDTNESGVFHYVTTDQVRFYKLDALQRQAHAGGGGYHPQLLRPEPEPVPLRDIPPLVFSEIMRDVDLFVGVASVGNDPAWSDGGPNGRFLNYWQSYSFGPLNASAKTRFEVLERLVPRLKIARQCSFDEKFLVVAGSVRTYKIHLGSGNILMKPNDQYLCIVPKQSVEPDAGVFLPFEGDRTLSLIISKAFLLAADDKITDPTILSQIRAK